MATLVMILKIIGIILLVILGILFLLLLAMLFVPVRYRASGKYEDGTAEGVAVISYLLHIVSVKISYKEDLKAVLKLFGIPVMRLYPKKENKAGKNDKESAQVGDRVQNKAADKDNETKDLNKTSDNSTETEELNTTPDKSTGTQKSNEKTDGPEGLVQKIGRFTDILNEPSTVRAWEVCKKRAGRLLRTVMPGKIEICVRYGLDDPYLISVIHAVTNVFYIYLGENIKLIPVYEGKYLDAVGKLKGHIILCPVLWHGMAVIFNKDCRRFYKLIKDNKK